MYSAKRRMLLYREDQGIDLGTPEYLVFQVLSRSNCRLPMLTTPHAAVWQFRPKPLDGVWTRNKTDVPTLQHHLFLVG